MAETGPPFSHQPEDRVNEQRAYTGFSPKGKGCGKSSEPSCHLQPS
jgi:hypothetical protein